MGVPFQKTGVYKMVVKHDVCIKSALTAVKFLKAVKIFDVVETGFWAYCDVYLDWYDPWLSFLSKPGIIKRDN